MCWHLGVGTMEVSEFKIVGMTIKNRFAGVPMLCDSHKAERLNFTKRWRDGFALYPIALEIGIGNGQSSVVQTAVMAQFDLEAGQNAVT